MNYNNITNKTRWDQEERTRVTHIWLTIYQLGYLALKWYTNTLHTFLAFIKAPLFAIGVNSVQLVPKGSYLPDQALSEKETPKSLSR